MLLGRIVFGIGSESLTVSQTSIVSMWFKNQELAFALSLNFSIPKLGSSLNSLLTPRLYNYHKNLTLPLLMGTVICVISWICGIFLCCMDRRNEKQEGKISKMSMRKKVNKMKKLKKSLINSEKATKKNCNKIQMAAMKMDSPLFVKDSHRAHSEAWIQVDQSSKESKESDLDCQSLNQSSLGGINLLKTETTDFIDEKFVMPEVVSLKDIRNLKTSFWILMVICMLTEGLVVPFLDNANKFYQYRFGYDSVTAGNILIIPYVLSAFLSPLFGLIIDKRGKRGKFIILTTFLFLVTHILFTVLPNSYNQAFFSIIPLIFLAICFSLYSSVIMPSLPLVVDAKILGTALGLVGMCQVSILFLILLNPIKFHILISYLRIQHWLSFLWSSEPFLIIFP